MKETLTIAKIKEECIAIINMLAHAEYEKLEELTGAKRLSYIQIKKAIEEYGETITPLPREGVEIIDIIKVTGRDEYSVRVDIWTKQSGRSDLSIELRFMLNHDSMHVEIDNIHVL
jgi:hypothetical protein